MRTWRRTAYRVVRPILFATDAERVHHLTLRALDVAGRSATGRALCRFASGAPRASEPVEAMGVAFRSRVGVGAGFDKDGVAIRGWAALGLGHVELGTVTPRSQPGNPRPRLHRLPAHEALVNSMGFNNRGADALARRVELARPRLPRGFVIGVNVGRNRETPAEGAVDDYVEAARVVAPVADYLAINVSSPNTPGVRDLGRADRIGPLVAAVVSVAGATPVAVKLSPDVDELELDELLDAVGATAAAGVILSNTSVRRDGLRGAAPAGGLSGRPLLPRTLATVARARERLGHDLAILASGGIGSADDATAVLDAGADLIQLWTGMVYAGPGLIGEALRQS